MSFSDGQTTELRLHRQKLPVRDEKEAIRADLLGDATDARFAANVERNCLSRRSGYLFDCRIRSCGRSHLSSRDHLVTTLDGCLPSVNLSLGKRQWEAGSLVKYFKNAVVALVLGISGASHAAETVTYTCDARGRLIKVERTGTVNDGAKVEYELDKAGNRKKVNSISS